MLRNLRRIESAAAICLAVALGSAMAQTPALRMSGRIVDASGSPVAGQAVVLRRAINSGKLQDSTVTTDAGGRFVFSGESGVIYQVNLTLTDVIWRGIGTIQVASGREVDMGKIGLRISAAGKPYVHLAGPVRITPLPTTPDDSIAAVYTACADQPGNFCVGATLHIVLADGKEVEPATEAQAVSSSSAQISDDRKAVGWLSDHGNCCTSYPLALKLRVYRPGKPIREFEGDGRAIFGWHFVGTGAQVAFYQNYPHFDSAPHYELRDVETGRELGTWDSDLSAKSPAWAKGLGPVPGF